MIPTRENSYFVVCYLINEPMFFINSTRPTTGKFVFERFGFADDCKRFAPNFFYQADDALNFCAVLFDPPRQIFKRRHIKFQVPQVFPQIRFRSCALWLPTIAVSSFRFSSDERFPAPLRSRAKYLSAQSRRPDCLSRQKYIECLL